MARRPQPKIATRLPKNYGLRIAESVFAITSILGAIAALATQKILWVAAPLTASVLINLHNRQKLNALSHQYALLRLSNIQQSLQNDLNGLQGRLQHHQQSYGQTKQAEFHTMIMSLTDILVGLESNYQNSSAPPQFSNLTTVVRDLKTQAEQSHHHLTALENYTVLESEHIHQLETVKKSLEQMRAPKQSGAKSWVQDYPQLFNDFSTDLATLQDRIQALTNQILQRHQRDAVPLQALPVHQLQAQVSTFSMQMQAKNREWSTQFDVDQAAMKRLQLSLKHIQDQLIDLQSMALNADRQTMAASAPEILAQIQVMVAPLQIQCVDLSNRLEHLSFEAEVTRSQSRQLQGLTEQVAAMQLKMPTITNEDLTSSAGDEVLP